MVPLSQHNKSGFFMKVLFINSVCGIRSTGRIVCDLADEYLKNGHECRIAYGREYVPDKYKNISYRITSDLGVRSNALKTRFFDNECFNAKRETKKFINWANDYNPDVLWIHNLHGYYINIEVLFDWIKSRPKMQVKWTIHDCWAFTGHCAYFSYVKCDKWQDCCHNCSQLKSYPKALFKDNSKTNYIRKKSAFTGVNDMTLIVPSEWLKRLIEKSFFNEYPIEVVHNKIDTDVFKPTESDFRQKYNLQNKKIILGVASVWDRRKGLDDFIELSKRLDDTYKIVLVGLSQKQIDNVPLNILCLNTTDSKEELAEIYSASDLFLNLSKEETFGLTTLEAFSCGTYPIVYKGTACEEVVNTYGGLAVDQNLDAVEEAIRNSV